MHIMHIWTNNWHILIEFKSTYLSPCFNSLGSNKARIELSDLSTVLSTISILLHKKKFATTSTVKIYPGIQLWVCTHGKKSILLSTILPLKVLVIILNTVMHTIWIVRYLTHNMVAPHDFFLIDLGCKS